MSLRTDFPELRVGRLCELFGMTKQAYYQSISRKCDAESNDELILQLVMDIRRQMPRLRPRKILHILRERYAVDVGRDHLFDLMRDNGLLHRTRKRHYSTTFSRHNLRTYHNLIKEIVPMRANEIWVSDITYIVFESEFRFLFLITDAYSKKIVGWKFSDNLLTLNEIAALKMALRQRQSKLPLIHHSDRGTQYCAGKYIATLKRHKIQPSMTDHGDPRENGVAERVNGILKNEFIAHQEGFSIDNAEKRIAEIIRIYNGSRPHLSLGMLTPNEAHSMTGEQNRLWKVYYRSKKEDNYEKNDNFANADNKDDDLLDRSPT